MGKSMLTRPTIKNETIMSADEYRAALHKLGLTQARAAELIGVNPRTSRTYALGEWPVPWLVELLLRLMIKYDIPTEEVARIADELRGMPVSSSDEYRTAMLLRLMRRYDISAETIERMRAGRK